MEIMRFVEILLSKSEEASLLFVLIFVGFFCYVFFRSSVAILLGLCTSLSNTSMRLSPLFTKVSTYITNYIRDFKICDATVTKTSFKIASSGLLIFFVVMSDCLTSKN